MKVTLALISIALVCVISVQQANSECCYDYRLSCRDGTNPTPYCATGTCDIRGCDCGGHCRRLEDGWSRGDIIACDMSFIAYHTMLYVGDGQVIHVVEDKNTNRGRIVKQSFSEAKQSNGLTDDCGVLTRLYDRRHRLPFSVDEIVRRAETDVGREVYYSLRCNCEHRVTGWRYGEKFSRQVPPIFGISSECN